LSSGFRLEGLPGALSGCLPRGIPEGRGGATALRRELPGVRSLCQPVPDPATGAELTSKISPEFTEMQAQCWFQAILPRRGSAGNRRFNPPGVRNPDGGIRPRSGSLRTFEEGAAAFPSVRRWSRGGQLCRRATPMTWGGSGKERRRGDVPGAQDAIRTIGNLRGEGVAGDGAYRGRRDRFARRGASETCAASPPPCPRMRVQARWNRSESSVRAAEGT
jgi:hypothetical protein